MFQNEYSYYYEQLNYSLEKCNQETAEFPVSSSWHMIDDQTNVT